MLLFLLTITGLLSIVLMIRSVLHDNGWLGIFGVISFILSILLTNLVQA
jgi:hypothetical protein